MLWQVNRWLISLDGHSCVLPVQAVLGFIKVLASCLEAKDLHDFVPAIVDGVLPWSSISRHHFRSKVTFAKHICFGCLFECMGS